MVVSVHEYGSLYDSMCSTTFAWLLNECSVLSLARDGFMYLDIDRVDIMVPKTSHKHLAVMAGGSASRCSVVHAAPILISLVLCMVVRILAL